MNEKPTMVIKVGGAAAGEQSTFSHLLTDVGELRASTSTLLVHGGGTQVTALARRLGIEPVFFNGVRMTSVQEMDVVDMVLCGLMNKQIVRRLVSQGIGAVGISGSDGGMFVGHAIMDQAGNPSRTGELDHCDPAILFTLISAGYIPVVASTFADVHGAGLNLNADDAALAIAEALSVDALLFLSDTPGILNRAGERIPVLTVSGVHSAIADETITGGMVVKSRACVNALNKGVKSIIIGRYSEPGDLQRLMEQTIGTRIEHD
jgi:acetylglutamate kinase